MPAPLRLARPFVLVLALLLGACAGTGYRTPQFVDSGVLDDGTVLRHASAGPLRAVQARLITGNDRAFRAKLAAINNARQTLDLMYFIFSDDESSSVIAQALVNAARRGVRVRLLVDYHTNYKRLDLFSLLERLGSEGDNGGSLQVRFYNRPARGIVMDAAWFTLGCRPATGAQGADCPAEKVRRLREAFDRETIDGVPASQLHISNLNVANSGLFLSGLYGKNPRLMALAVLSAQQSPPELPAHGPITADQRQRLLRLARLHWRAETGDLLDKLSARLQLAFITQFYGEEVNPIYELFARYLPVERLRDRRARLEWEHLTDFLHHKFLLADGRELIIGGRNIENSYHMRPNPLVEKYIFRDTDLRVVLAEPDQALTASFERLWRFRPLVARLDEVRAHAPNEIATNLEPFLAASRQCANVAGEADRAACVEYEFNRHKKDLRQRETERLLAMRARARRYWQDYPYARTPDPEPLFAIANPGALLAYVENLPFRGGPHALRLARSFGARDGQEAASGKRIHALWLAGLESVCRQASAGDPAEIVLHNAYFAPPANLIRAFGRMVSGELPCPHVTLTVVTNSLETTDLVPVNLLARHAVKAFAEYAQAHYDPEKSARFRYFEYRPLATASHKARISLHSKVSLLGDDLVVGSANTDLRSYLMDTNNALFIRRAPGLLAGYKGYLARLLRDPGLLAERTDFFRTATHARLLAEDRALLDATARKYRVQRWLDDNEIHAAEAAVLDLLHRAYQLTGQILNGDRDAARLYNRLFETI